MPLFKRNSSKERSEVPRETGDRDAKSSAFISLSRRGSRRSSTDEHAKKPSAPSTHTSQEHAFSQPSPKLTQEGSVKGGQISTPAEPKLPIITHGMTKEDVQSLFHGAPHFTLEKGKRGKVFPKVHFPWDKDMDVADLGGRKWLQHETFALATMHGHLPIPDELSWKPSHTGPQTRNNNLRRPIFDLGVFEVPNMLSMGGTEPGTVGAPFYLEMPVADRLRSPKQAKQEEKENVAPEASPLASFEQFKALHHNDGAATIGKRAPYQDRIQLIRGGSDSWKRIGLREIGIPFLLERWTKIRRWHEEVVSLGFKGTVLDKQSSSELYDELFTKIVFPPREVAYADEAGSLKIQIEALIKVLTTPGAWLDLSVLALRVHFTQLLWELPPHHPGEEEGAGLAPGTERTWILIQIALAVELVIRVDALMRLGLAENSGPFHISSEDMHHFNKLRTTKADWDMILARRFLDLMVVEEVDVSSFSVGEQTHEEKAAGKLRLPFKHKHDAHNEQEQQSTWECGLLPRLADLQLEGLFRFARYLDWPGYADLEKAMQAKLHDTPESHVRLFAAPIASAMEQLPPGSVTASQVKKVTPGPHWVKRPCMILQPATADTLGGWPSRSWLTGLTLPGDAIHGFLMATLLENDTDAMAKLGRIAYIQGGFVLDGRSWWDKLCIVGRIVGPLTGTLVCVGWLASPPGALLPVDATGQPYQNTWLDVVARDPPLQRQGLRIHDGEKMTAESSPLGIGHGKVQTEEFLMVTDSVLDSLPAVHIEYRGLTLAPWDDMASLPEDSLRASVKFSFGSPAADATNVTAASSAPPPKSIVLELTYDIFIVSSHACKPPHGHVVFPTGSLPPTAHPDKRQDDEQEPPSQQQMQHPQHRHAEHLPAHPLHNSYHWVPKSLAGLPLPTSHHPVSSSALPNPTQPSSTSPVWIIDARGPDPGADIFARAWCAAVGRHALVSRVGRTCFGCAVREARALELGVVIRVGGERGR